MRKLSWSQVAGSSSVRNLPMGEQKAEDNFMFISTSSVYHIEANTTSVKPCEDERCVASVVLASLRSGEDECSFACSEMSGESCGSYGLMLSKAHRDRGNETSYMCWASRLYRALLGNGNHLEVLLWYEADSQFSLSCYVWCSEDGHLPRKPTGEDLMGTDFFLDLVRFLLT